MPLLFAVEGAGMNIRAKGYGPGCPFCGSIRSTSMENGWSEPDDYYLRRKRCNECQGGFVTFEAIVPVGETTFYRLDYRGRHNRRAYYRTRRSRTKRTLPSLTKASDQLLVSVHVKERGKSPDICFRGHPFSKENTYVYPDSGYRQCRICRKNRQRQYWAERKVERDVAA